MQNRIVLVTGGAGNLGRSVTRLLLEAEARVAVPVYSADRPDALDELKAAHGERLHPFALDLTTERGAKAAIKEVLEWAGGLNAVAHLIGGYRGGTRVADTPMADWERMIDLNLRSAWLVARAALPPMLEGGGGSFLFVSGQAAWKNRARHAAYAVAKAGLITLTEAIAEEYGKDGIRANALVPRTLDTEDNRRAMPDADHSLWTTTDEAAYVARFLLSDAAAAINGAAVPV
jgi:NAD(P)-dependent dehydrogenase (short-subunit alcohol dehydrogenase family)